MSFYPEHTSYHALGTATAPVTLTADYADNLKVLRSRHLPNINILGSYVPGAGSTNTLLNLTLEMSEDGTNWFPVPVQENTSTVIKMHTEGPMYYQYPGDGTSSASTAVPISLQFTCAAEYIRISAKEVSSGGSAGTLWLDAALASN